MALIQFPPWLLCASSSTNTLQHEPDAWYSEPESEPECVGINRELNRWLKRKRRETVPWTCHKCTFIHLEDHMAEWLKCGVCDTLRRPMKE